VTSRTFQQNQQNDRGTIVFDETRLFSNNISELRMLLKFNHNGGVNLQKDLQHAWQWWLFGKKLKQHVQQSYF